jgi:hypothetical protein
MAIEPRRGAPVTHEPIENVVLDGGDAGKYIASQT